MPIHTKTHHRSIIRRSLCICTGMATALVMIGTTIQAAAAASSWNPTLLVNTESFQAIDSGDGTTNIELRFGASTQTIKFLTTNRFQFSHGISVLGTISGSSLNVDRNATIGGGLTVTGAVLANGNITTRGTASGSNFTFMGGASYVLGSLAVGGTTPKTKFSVLGTISGSSLNIDRNATIGGTLTATGAITTKGNLSGSTLTVDGNVTIHGETYTFPTTQTENGFLKTNGAGELTWEAISTGNGSGAILSLHPEYPNAIYFSSGSSFIGQLSASGGVAGINENFYHWTSSKAGLNDYWISIRVRLPDNFSSWDPVKPIELRYRTADGTADNNHVTVRMKDTEDALAVLSGNAALASATFATANIGITDGTWTPKDYITIYVKLAAKATTFAEAGFINLNFETTTP
ncbi:MAG: hypothetical protein PHZ00_02200 [Candidatus Peribacteraceae bacterium]|nr:hypothetical protein [Candidatus Peribacteraceae bacterium]